VNCRQAQHHICLESDGALTVDQRAALSTHLDGCDSCRRLQRALVDGLSAWQTAAQDVRVPNADFEWQKVRREIRGPARPTTPWRWTWVALPAAAAAVIAGVYFVPAPTGHDRMSASPAMAAASPAIATPSPAIAPTVPAATISEAASTVVYVDDRSGWTFVLGDDSPTTHI
jgi:hypothetical protein